MVKITISAIKIFSQFIFFPKKKLKVDINI